MSETKTEWQRGYDLGYLKTLANVFKASHKHLVFGAFGLVNERAVADALAEERIYFTGNPPRAVAIVHRPKQDSLQSDFSQREWTIPAGETVIRGFAAGTEEAGAKNLSKVLAGEPGTVWAEVFEEDAVSKAAILRAGFAYVTTKISAGSEIRGVYRIARAGRKEGLFSGAGLPLPGPLTAAEAATQIVIDPDYLNPGLHTKIAAEAEDYGNLFAQHYSSYNKRKSWTSFALRGYDDDPGFIIKPMEMSKKWKEENAPRLKDTVRWTTAADKFPATRRVAARFEEMGCMLDRVRFMKLAAKNGELSRHADITDREAGVADGFIARLHIPIVTSPQVIFHGWTARGRHLTGNLPARALCYLDQRKPHAVTNGDAKIDRVHLVLDVYCNEALRNLISAAVGGEGRVKLR